MQSGPSDGRFRSSGVCPLSADELLDILTNARCLAQGEVTGHEVAHLCTGSRIDSPFDVHRFNPTPRTTHRATIDPPTLHRGTDARTTSTTAQSPAGRLRQRFDRAAPRVESWKYSPSWNDSPLQAAWSSRATKRAASELQRSVAPRPEQIATSPCMRAPEYPHLTTVHRRFKSQR
jgi:hypothetical protein